MSETDRNRLSRRFTVDFNYNSNHIEGNTLTYGQTELLLLFGKVSGMAEFRDYEEMKASNVGLKMMSIEALETQQPLTQNFIRTLHKTLLREDYTVYRNLPGGMQTSYTVHAGQYKTRPNSVITRYGDHFEYASPEETPALMTDLVDWYNKAEAEGKLSPVELAVLFHYRYIRRQRAHRPPDVQLYPVTARIPDDCGTQQVKTRLSGGIAPGRLDCGCSPARRCARLAEGDSPIP